MGCHRHSHCQKPVPARASQRERADGQSPRSEIVEGQSYRGLADGRSRLAKGSQRKAVEGVSRRGRGVSRWMLLSVAPVVRKMCSLVSDQETLVKRRCWRG